MVRLQEFLRRDRVLKTGTDQPTPDSSRACHETGRLAERQSEEDLKGEEGLDRRVAVGLLTTATPSGIPSP